MKTTAYKYKLIQSIRSRPRLLFSFLLAALTYQFLPEQWAMHNSTRFIISWNVGAALYLLLSLEMMFGATTAHMQ